MLQRQQQMAGGHARSAHQHHLARIAPVQQRLQFRAQFLRRAQAPIAQVLAQRAVDRARHVSGDRIDRFDLAAEALSGACIQQPARRLVQARGDLVGSDDTAGIEALRIRRQRRRRCGGFGFRQAMPAPFGQAAVEHGDAAMPEQGQHPPQPRGGHAAVAGVVDDHLGVRRDTQAPKRLRERIGLGQRMPAQARTAQVGQIRVEIGVHRSGQMRLRVGLARELRGLRIGKRGGSETRIHDAQVRVAERGGQGRRINQPLPVG